MGASTTVVPAVDLARENAWLAGAAHEALSRLMSLGEFIGGDCVDRLEHIVAGHCGTSSAVAVNSGTDALALALRVLGVRPGDEVVTVANSFVATAGAIVQVGATPVFCDVDDDELMSPDALRATVTGQTSAVIAVHLRGRVADIAALRRVTKVPIVEDASQAYFAREGNAPAGSLGDMGCFSLHPLKNPGALGDAGMITTHDQDAASRLRRLRNHGLADRDTCKEWGVNSRLDALQAAILIAKMARIEELIAARKQIACWYDEALAGVAGVALPPRRDGWVYYSYVIRVPDRRDVVRDRLMESGISALIHYPVPIHLQPAAHHLGYRPGSLPNTERQASEILSLPIFATMTEGEVGNVVDAVRRALI